MTQNEGVDRELAREAEHRRHQRQRLIVALVVGLGIAAFVIATLVW